MLLLWLVTAALSASPDLHHFLHQEAQNATHNCLITQLQHQPLLVAFAVFVSPPPVALPLEASHFAEFQLLPALEYRLSPSRAPPLA